MLRAVARAGVQAVCRQQQGAGAVLQPRPAAVNLLARRSITEQHVSHETDETTDAQFIAYFERPELDGWELRKALTDLHGHDMVPEPAIVISVLHACRRLNDISLAIRYLESAKKKCGSKKNQAVIWPYIMQEIQPTLDELGVPSLEKLGYDEPELWMEQYDMLRHSGPDNDPHGPSPYGFPPGLEHLTPYPKAADK